MMEAPVEAAIVVAILGAVSLIISGYCLYKIGGLRQKIKMLDRHRKVTGEQLRRDFPEPSTESIRFLEHNIERLDKVFK